jgi:hypothetical protein
VATGHHPGAPLAIPSLFDPIAQPCDAERKAGDAERLFELELDGVGAIGSGYLTMLAAHSSRVAVGVTRRAQYGRCDDFLPRVYGGWGNYSCALGSDVADVFEPSMPVAWLSSMYGEVVHRPRPSRDGRCDRASLAPITDWLAGLGLGLGLGHDLDEDGPLYRALTAAVRAPWAWARRLSWFGRYDRQPSPGACLDHVPAVALPAMVLAQSPATGVDVTALQFAGNFPVMVPGYLATAAPALSEPRGVAAPSTHPDLVRA